MEEPIEVSLEIARILEKLGIETWWGGSFASSLHGQPRSTQDIDIIADIGPEHIAPLLSALRGGFYFDEPAIRDAVGSRATFNVIHLRTLFKVDVFVAGDDVPTVLEMERRQRYTLAVDPPEDIIVASPEDIVVQKLYWHRLGDHVSERQWDDAMNVLKIRGRDLDLSYMRDLAGTMKVEDLLDRALRQAGLHQARAAAWAAKAAGWNCHKPCLAPRRDTNRASPARAGNRRRAVGGPSTRQILARCTSGPRRRTLRFPSREFIRPAAGTSPDTCAISPNRWKWALQEAADRQGEFLGLPAGVGTAVM